MAQPAVITKTLAASSGNNIATNQSGASGVAMTLNGTTVTAGIATLDTQRRVLVTSSGNDAGVTFTITGTNETGNPISEAITGASGTGSATLQDYLTVTAVTPSTGTASGVTIGTTSTGSSSWKLVDDHVTPTSVALGGQVTTGSATWGVEYTYDQPQGVPPNTGNIPWTYATSPFPLAHSVLVGSTGTADGVITMPVRAWRLTITAGTGTVKLTGAQAGIA